MIAGQPPTSSPTSDLVDVPLLRSQVRGSKIMAAIRIHRFGKGRSSLFLLSFVQLLFLFSNVCPVSVFQFSHFTVSLSSLLDLDQSDVIMDEINVVYDVL